MLTSILGFATVSFAIAIAPGPSWAYVITTTIRFNRRAGWFAVMGNATGIVCHLMIATSGLSLLLTASATAYSVTKWIGALYLVYLGVRMILRRTLAQTSTAVGATSTVQVRSATVYGRGVLVNLLNPKAALLMLALLPQFVDASAKNVTLQTLYIGSLHVLIASVVLGCLVLVVSSGASRLATSADARAVARRVGGSVLVVMGVQLALSGRP